jgi:hypothetical protein
MTTLSGRIGTRGPMIDLTVMQSPQRVDALKRAARPYSAPMTVLALLDTGAASSVVDRDLIASLGLGHRGEIHIHTPSTGTAYESRNTFDATLAIGGAVSTRLVLTLQVIESDLASEWFFALIGRDVLEHCVFIFDGPRGEFTLSFEPPGP